MKHTECRFKDSGPMFVFGVRRVAKEERENSLEDGKQRLKKAFNAHMPAEGIITP
jgi:hypothetical protein